MNSKIRVTSAAVLAVVAACAFTAAPVHPAARAMLHHITTLSPRTGFTGDRLCDLAFSTLCMSGNHGEGQPVTGTTNGNDMNEFVATSNCNNGKVSDGAMGQGPPCPFASGTGLNTEFDNLSIVEFDNVASGRNYAAFDEPGGWGVIEESSGNGQLWVQQGDLSGLHPNAALISVLASDSNNGESVICANGNGNQLLVTAETNPPDTCRWFNAGS